MPARARIVPREAVAHLETLALDPFIELPRQAHVAPAPVVDASAQARSIVQEAEKKARAILHQAERAAAETLLQAHAKGRAEGLAEIAAWSARLARQQAEMDERALDRLVALSRVLAERLLGHALDLDDTLVVSLARQALSEALGARQVTLIAHPEDAARLRPYLAELSDTATLHLAEDDALDRGDLRLETEIGTLDAHVGRALERLATRLRDRLAPSAPPAVDE